MILTIYLMNHWERTGPKGHFLLNILRTPLAKVSKLNLVWGICTRRLRAMVRAPGKRRKREMT